MNPNTKQMIQGVRDILGYVALAFALVALAKLFGVPMTSIPGNVEQIALVAIALKMA